MAKNPIWLRGAKGKLAGMVLQKASDGGTMVRENVTPKNPRSVGQMATRLAFGQVNTAAAALNSLINHAFEGVSVGKMSRRKFVSLNVSRLKNYALQQYNGQGTVDLAGFSPKGLNIPIPNKLIVSRGSLVRSDYCRAYAAADGTIKFGTGGSDPIDIDLDPGFTYLDMLTVMGFKPGDEFSVVEIKAAYNDSTITSYGEATFGNGVRPAIWRAARIVFKGYDDLISENENWNSPVSQFTQFSEILSKMILSDLTSDDMYDFFAQFHDFVPGQDGSASVTIPTAFALPTDKPILAAATIVSRWDGGIEKRSNEDMVTTTVANANGWFGLTFDNAYKTYAQEKASSDLFLNQGGDNQLGAAEVNPQ